MEDLPFGYQEVQVERIYFDDMSYHCDLYLYFFVLFLSPARYLCAVKLLPHFFDKEELGESNTDGSYGFHKN